MKRLLTMALSVIAVAAIASAEVPQALTVNGEAIDGKTVKQLAIDREQVTVVFDDGTTIDDVTTLSLIIGSTGLQGISYYDASARIVGNSLTVKGLSGLSPIAVYDIKGRQVAAAPLSTEATIDISNLAAGVYSVRAGNQVIKFIKQ